MATDVSTRSPLTSPAAIRREVDRLREATLPSRLGELGVRAIVRSDRLDALAAALQRALQGLTRIPGCLRAKDFLNGTWLGHPLHPALTDIPIGAWTTALVFDGLAAGRSTKLRRGAKAAVGVGIAGAAVSALSGLADWTDTSASQRRIGFVHAGLNSLALGFQVASFIRRRRRLDRGRALSVLGYGTALIAAYLGGSLVFRQGTMVNRTAYHRGRSTFTPALPEEKLEAERPTRAMVDGTAVMLVKHDGEVFALDDVCAHAGCSLSQGRLRGDAIVCACHGSTYRLRDGAVLHGPSPFSQPSLEVRVDNGLIAVRERR